jgi:hypothetical protein
MSLVEGDKLIAINGNDFAGVSAAMQGWQHLPASVIWHHGGPCCHIAREWVLSTDYSQLNASNPLTGPRWLRHKYNWGPSSWPIHWCEAVEQKTLDCGALAAMAQEVFAARGVKSYPAQLIQQYTEDAARQWRKRWGNDEISMHWIKEDLIYHEGCAVVVRDDEIKMWDPSAGWWINPTHLGGYGGLLAVRVIDARAGLPVSLQWATHTIVANRWQQIERVGGDLI